MELEIPEEYKEYEAEPGQFENFLLCDTGPGPNRVLIFGRQRGIRGTKVNIFYVVFGLFYEQKKWYFKIIYYTLFY